MKKLSFILDGLIKEKAPDIEVENIRYSPEECKEKDILFLTGNKAKEDYMKLRPKSCAVVCDSLPENMEIANIYIVENVRKTLAIALARFYCNDLTKLKFIGITGTNGKSTTAIMVEKILSDQGLKVGYIGTGVIRIGNKILSDRFYSMTTPPPELLYSSIRKMEDAGVEIVIMEVSSHALKQERTAAIGFDIGIFTNLSEEHLDYHENMYDYFATKKKLFLESKMIVVNSDDRYGSIILKEFACAEGCGTDLKARVRIRDIISHGFSGTEFIYQSEGGEAKVNLQIPGKYNVYNAMLAIACVEKLGVTVKDAKSSLEKIKKIEGRFNIIESDITVIIDYAHTLNAFENLLKSVISNKNSRQNLFLVFGCGGERDKHKRSRIGSLCEKYSDNIILTSDNPRGENPMEIICDIKKSMKNPPTVIENRSKAIRFAIGAANAGDIVAIIGKGPEKYSIHGGIYSHFDEEDIVKNALKERRP